MDFSLAAARQASQQLEDRIDIGLDTGANVEGSDGLRREGSDVRLRHIADIHEIAGLCAVPVDARDLTAQQPPAENGDDTRFAVGILARAVHIRIAQRGVRKAMHRVKRPQIHLAGQLRGAVR